MSDNWRDRLSEYLDDELGATDREMLERHLEECTDCSQVLDELKRVVGRAQALDDRRPDVDLWAGVARRIGASVPSTPEESVGHRMPSVWRRRFSYSAPQLLAAGLAVLMISASGWAFWMSGDEAVPSVAEQPVEPGPVALVPVSLPETRSDAAVADLEQLLATERETLSPETVKVIEESLATIDRALARAREAVLADPESDYLRSHLEQTTRQKLTLLQRVTAIASAS